MESKLDVFEELLETWREESFINYDSNATSRQETEEHKLWLIDQVQKWRERYKAASL